MAGVAACERSELWCCPMAQHAFDDAMASTAGGPRSAPVSAGGGWKRLFWFAVAAAGVGFAGYVYFVPYHQMANALDSRSRELGEERRAGQALSAERDRLAAGAGASAAPARAAEPYPSEAARPDDGKRRAAVTALSEQLATPLQELG